MRNFKAKLTAFLMTISCFAVCLGAGVAIATQPEVSQVTASAETTVYEIGSLDLHVNSSVGGAAGANNQLYLKRADGGELPVQDWSILFTHESGEGFKINDVATTAAEIKSTGDGFFWLFGALQAGDEVSISGTFYCASADVKYVIEESRFVWTGSKWEKGVVYTTYTFNKLNGANGCTDSVIYAYPTDGDALPSGDWDNRFTLKSGAGLQLNGTTLSGWEIKQPGDFYIVLGKTAVAGDVLTINGTFINETTAKKFVFNNCVLEYNGTTWVTSVAYTTYTFNELSAANGCTDSVIYAYPTDGDTLPSGDWDNRFALKSGAGLKLNDTTLSGWEIKQPGDFYIVLGKTAVAGDVFTIDGTFVNEATAKKFVFNNCKLQFNGTTWVTVKTYTTYNLGKVVAVVDGSASAGYLQFADGVELPISSWDYAFMLFSGNGITVDGEPVDMTNNLKSVGGKLYVTLTPTPASVNSTLSIGGTFYNEELGIKYVVEESKFTWNGSAWVDYIDYTTYDIGALTVSKHSASAGVNAQPGFIYLDRADGQALPIQLWSNPFTHVSGDGLKLNGEAISFGEMQSSDAGIFMTFAEVKAGDTLSISGTFACPTQAVKYVIAESKFTWNGSAWENYIDYTTINTGKLTHKDGNATSIYLKRADGVDLEIATTENDLHWTTAFAFEADSGVGITLNGAQISMNDVKFPGSMYIGLGTTAKAGDVLVVGGTFYSSKLAYKYVIEESKFVFNGTTWSDWVSTYTISNLQPTAANNGTKNIVYLKVNGDTNLPITDSSTFALQDGGLVKEGGSTIRILGAASTSDGFKLTLLQANVTANVKCTLSGTFYCSALDVTYIIEECTMMWTGSAWTVYKEPINYTTYTFNELSGANNCTDSVIYAYPTKGDSLPGGDWDNRFTLESGDGLKLNGTTLSNWEIKQPGDFYIVLGKTAVAGDEFTINGTFINEATAKKFVFNNCALVYDGTTWKTKADISEYAEYNLGALTVGSPSNNGTASTRVDHLYLDRVDGQALPFPDGNWKTIFVYESGDGVRINGSPATLPENIKSTDAGLWFAISGVQPGDVVSISGTFVCSAEEAIYVIEESRFIWNGYFWENEGEYVTYEIGKVYATNEAGSGAAAIHLAQYSGNDYAIKDGTWEKTLAFATNSGVGLTLNGVQIAMNDIKIPNNIYVGFAGTPANVHDILVIGGTFYNRSLGVKYVIEESSFAWNGTEWINGNFVDGVVITYEDTHVEYVSRGTEYTLSQGKSNNTFIAWLASDGTIYTAGQTIELTESLSLTAIILDFTLEEGAAIRLNTSADSSGIRFTTKIDAADLAALEAYGITVKSYGTLIMPFDYLGRNQAPNLTDFAAGSGVLQIASTYSETDGDYIVYRGAMQKLYEGNYARLFAGRGYMELTVNGQDIIVYTPFDMKENVRSIRNVAYKFQSDTAEYNKVSDTKKAVVDAYAAQDEINLMNYAAYANNNFLHLIAWYYPALDESNGYNNEANIAIAKKIKDAGMTAVYLDGAHHLSLNSYPNVEKTRQIIEFFWSQGLYTIAFGSNASTNLYLDYTATTFPDFSDCDGFMGYLVWDEPQSGSFGTLAQFANNFENVYAGTDAIFMANLLPSYAAIFNGTTNWWQSSISSLKKDEYKAYVKNYCDTVLSQVEGEKWLSMDSYPINADETLTANFLFDLAILKYYSMEYDAHAHAALQSSGWVEDGNDSKNRMPTEAEMRMQAYAAMAFGVDSISWWSYSDKRGDNQLNPTDNNDYYTRFVNVNNELSAISAIYSAFDWKGVILGKGYNISNADYDAYNIVKGQIGDYELSASDTKLLSSVSSNKTSRNYLMGVMEDMNGNEGYVICNYNNHKADRAQTLTLTFDTNITEVVIYRGGVATTVAVSGKTLSIDLATGEGVIVLPSRIG